MSLVWLHTKISKICLPATSKNQHFEMLKKNKQKKVVLNTGIWIFFSRNKKKVRWLQEAVLF